MVLYNGVIAAVPTPFDSNLNFLYDTYVDYLHFLMNNGVRGVLVAGSTGEGTLLSDDEYKTLIDVAKKEGADFVVAGITAIQMDAIYERAHVAKGAGADALLIPPSPYVKPNDLVEFYVLIGGEADLPIIAYNVPSRTGTDLAPMLERILDEAYPKVLGLKEATEDVFRVAKMAKMVKDKNLDFVIYSGSDFVNLPMLSVGAGGLISVLAAIVPDRMAEIYTKFMNGDLVNAIGLNQTILKLTETLFIESNPVPLKAGLEYLGIFPTRNVRRPLWPASQATYDAMVEALNEAGYYP